MHILQERARPHGNAPSLLEKAMQHPPSTLAPRKASSVSEPVAGVIGGLVAGAAYLAAQVSFTAAAHPGGALEPLQRIAAILMGPDVAPQADFVSTVFGMTLVIHLTLSMVFGRIVSVLTWRQRPGPAVLIGALVGLALYGLNFGLIAPGVFPWFSESIRAVTLANHALFGAVAAAVCLALRGPSSRTSGI
jgi:hypothetical protein